MTSPCGSCESVRSCSTLPDGRARVVSMESGRKASYPGHVYRETELERAQKREHSAPLLLTYELAVAASAAGNPLWESPPRSGASVRDFDTNQEWLQAMTEDLSDWFQDLLGIESDPECFFELIERGCVLCSLANRLCEEVSAVRNEAGEETPSQWRRRLNPFLDPPVESFHARDNVASFISWSRDVIGLWRAARVRETVTFETDDLVLRKNEKSVVLTLLEVARCGYRLGLTITPTLIRLEAEIEAELSQSGSATSQEDNQSESRDSDYSDTCEEMVQRSENDPRTLDQLVLEQLRRCTCPLQFPMKSLGNGKYKIGDSSAVIFVRVLRSHVMVRVGGGWDTLEHYLDRHDPCRCGAHRVQVPAAMYQANGWAIPSTPDMRRSRNSTSAVTPNVRHLPVHPQTGSPHYLSASPMTSSLRSEKLRGSSSAPNTPRNRRASRTTAAPQPAPSLHTLRTPPSHSTQRSSSPAQRLKQLTSPNNPQQLSPSHTAREPASHSARDQTPHTAREHASHVSAREAAIRNASVARSPKPPSRRIPPAVSVTPASAVPRLKRPALAESRSASATPLSNRRAASRTNLPTEPEMRPDTAQPLRRGSLSRDASLIVKRDASSGRHALVRQGGDKELEKQSALLKREYADFCRRSIGKGGNARSLSSSNQRMSTSGTESDMGLSSVATRARREPAASTAVVGGADRPATRIPRPRAQMQRCDSGVDLSSCSGRPLETTSNSDLADEVQFEILEGLIEKQCSRDTESKNVDEEVLRRLASLSFATP